MSKSGPGGQSGILIVGPGGERLTNLQAQLPQLSLEQYELLNRAKRYATEQSIRSITEKPKIPVQPVTSTHKLVQPPEQQRALQRHQALVLMCRVYVGSISFEAREETIKTVFSPYGTIKSINMSWDPVTLKHKGFAFVEYELPEAAQLALEHMNGLQIGGRQIKVGRPSNMPQAKPVIQQIQEECKQNNRIYVSNVHPELNEQELAEMFEPFGKVRSCKLAMTPNVEQPQHRGCGFIEFETEEAANEALSMDNYDLGLTKLHVCQATTPADNVSTYGTLESSIGGTQTQPNINNTDDIQLQLERANQNHADNEKQMSGTNGLQTDTSSVIILRNMVTTDDEIDENLHLDVYEECSKHGTVSQVVIYTDKMAQQTQDAATSDSVHAGEVKIFVKYTSGAGSQKALNALNGRCFDGRRVVAEQYDRELFRRHIYTGNTNE